MSRTTLFEAPGITLWYYPSTRIIHHEMTRYPGVEALEGALMCGLDALAQHGASKWLSDDRRSGALPKSHHEWGSNVWAPKAAAAGWRHWALLPPTELLGEANMRRLAERYASLGVTVQTFRDVPTALRWLESQ